MRGQKEKECTSKHIFCALEKEFTPKQMRAGGKQSTPKQMKENKESTPKMKENKESIPKQIKDEKYSTLKQMGIRGKRIEGEDRKRIHTKV